MLPPSTRLGGKSWRRSASERTNVSTYDRCDGKNTKPCVLLRLRSSLNVSRSTETVQVRSYSLPKVVENTSSISGLCVATNVDILSIAS
ncbi:Uncharacterised protein [Mycobacteroides abscessus subsp. abscessus]|nr:Uncharacterised protein [Mycobacteroides abscessus subsp. abscessus]